MTFRVKLQEVDVEPFLLDLWHMRIHCPWCQQTVRFSAGTTIHGLLTRVSSHVKEVHPDKHSGVPIGFLLAEPPP